MLHPIPVKLTWSDISYKVLQAKAGGSGERKSHKVVLHPCSGAFMPREAIAIMGPSGAGALPWLLFVGCPCAADADACPVSWSCSSWAWSSEAACARGSPSCAAAPSRLVQELQQRVQALLLSCLQQPCLLNVPLHPGSR